MDMLLKLREFFVQNSWLSMYLLGINVITFVLFGVDKYKAIKGKFRIQNGTLLGLAFLGGSVGALLGMAAFRHKIRKKYYTVGVLLMLGMQMTVLMLAVGEW